MESYIQANENRWAAVGTTGNLGTTRITTRKLVDDLMNHHFNIDELEEVVFDVWGKSAEGLNLNSKTKRQLVMAIILYSLETGKQKSLVGVLKEHRDFVDWPDFE